MLSTSTYFYDYDQVVHDVVSYSSLVSADEDVLKLYVNMLKRNHLPVLLDENWISLFFGVNANRLYSIINNTSAYYRSYKVPKKSGSGFRCIDEPLPLLKSIQRNLLDTICSAMPIHDSVYSYREGITVKDNANVHIGSQYIYKFDIENFFLNITTAKVFNSFLGVGYSSLVSSILTGLCVYGGALPQGAPTSSSISNTILYDFDCEVSNWCKARNYKYSRYSDDITVSSSVFDGDVRPYIFNVIEKHHFRINKDKFKIFRPGSAKFVTGIQLGEKIRSSAKFRKKLKDEVYYIGKFGIDNHAQRVEQEPYSCIQRIRGQINYALWVDPKDKDLLSLKSKMAEILISYLA